MGYRNREKEVKLVLTGTNQMARVNRYLRKELKNHRRLIIGDSEDRYFFPPKTQSGWPSPKADFVRIRTANHDAPAYLTIKFTDKGSVQDRVEKDLKVGDHTQAKSILLDLACKPAGTIRKRYIVYFMGAKGDESDTTIALYQIKGDKRVFLEIEAKSIHIMRFWAEKLLAKLPFSYYREKRSLFNIFIRDHGKAPKIKASGLI